MEEVIEYQTVEHGSPCEHCTYKDESWGMWLPHVTARRGGKTSGWGVALSTLVRFQIHDAQTGAFMSKQLEK